MGLVFNKCHFCGAKIAKCWTPETYYNAPYGAYYRESVSYSEFLNLLSENGITLSTPICDSCFTGRFVNTKQDDYDEEDLFDDD